MQKQPRRNKTKEEIAEDMAKLAKTKKQIVLAKLLFPFMSEMKTIYDAQTALSATSGYIKAELEKRALLPTVKELGIDLKDEPESDIKQVMIKLLGQLEIENANDCVDLLESYTRILGQYGQNEFLKNPFSVLKVTDLIKD